MNEGWKCPVCGNGLAPWVSVCPCHKAPKQQTVHMQRAIYEIVQAWRHHYKEIRWGTPECASNQLAVDQAVTRAAAFLDREE